MDATGLNLLIPDKADEERDALAEAFCTCGGAVHRIGRFWDPPVFDPSTVRVYGPDSFCLVLQQKIGFALCSPDDELILRLPQEHLRRRLVAYKLADIQGLVYPVFIKPVVPKQFRGVVYQSAALLEIECRGCRPETQIMVSEVVNFAAEVRCFVLDGRVLDAAAYEGTGVVSDASGFVNGLAGSISLPRAVVVDVGFIPDRGWSVVEFNAAWGAGLNGCNPELVLPAISAASGPSC